jgi:hypothetical protein
MPTCRSMSDLAPYLFVEPEDLALAEAIDFQGVDGSEGRTKGSLQQLHPQG